MLNPELTKVWQVLTELAPRETGRYLDPSQTPAYRSANLVRLVESMQNVRNKAQLSLDKPVAPKLLLPILESATLESDPELLRYWGGLLATAAGPEGTKQVHPAYIAILRELSRADAQLLTSLWTIWLGTDYGIPTGPDGPIERVLMDENREKMPIRGVEGWSGRQPYTDEEISFDNLFRLGLIMPLPDDHVLLNALGHAFMQACGFIPEY